MVPNPDRGDRRGATDEGRPEDETEGKEEGEGERQETKEGQKPEQEPARPDPELRWVQLREPKQAVEIGRNGRVLDSRFHEGYDAWEVLLETYEGEP